MPKKTTADPNKPKKTRKRNESAYVAKIVGDDMPTVIIAYTQAEALKAVVTLREATHQDLMDAGKHSWPQINAAALSHIDLTDTANDLSRVSLGTQNRLAQ